jgi:hypothetical protein
MLGPADTLISDSSDAVPTFSGGQLFYYTQRGSTVGPVALSVLKTLVQNGTLGPGDLVWRENADVGVNAGEMPALAPLFGQLSYSGGGARYNQVAGSGKSPTAASMAARTYGIAAGALMLVLINLPWLVVDHRAVWWWDLFDAPDAYFGAMFVTYIVLASIALCIIGSLTSGMLRGTIYLCLTGGAWIFLSAVILRGGGNPENIVPLAVPLALAMIVGTTFFRSVAPQATSGRVLLGLCSGVATLGMFVGIINNLVDRPLTGIPSGIVFGAALCFMGLLAGLVAGILGFVGLKPVFSIEVNKITGVLAAIALLLPGLGIFIAIVTSHNFFNSPLESSGDWPATPTGDVLGIIVEILVRLLLISYCWLVVLIVGIRETLTEAHLKPKQ